MVQFGLYYTKYNKSKLFNAHKFYTEILNTIDESKRSYFPDLITCVSYIPFFSIFGLRDSYGLMYKLSPTINEYKLIDPSGNHTNFLDLISIYLDVLKATQIMISQDYFLKKMNENDVGVIREIKGSNVHLRGKLRRIHNLRLKHRCRPDDMKLYSCLLYTSPSPRD